MTFANWDMWPPNTCWKVRHSLHWKWDVTCQCRFLSAYGHQTPATDRLEGDQAASPAVFVYTLPNVVSGEMASATRYKGKNTFSSLEAYQPEKLERYTRIVMQKGN